MGYFASIFLITCFFSFGVQVIYYFYLKFKNPKFLESYHHVFNYLSGIIGDLILVPLLNVFAFLSLTYSPFSLELLLLAIPLGVLTTFLFHYFQARFKQINWTMPEVGKWNSLGLYHCLFQFCETIFLWYVLLNYFYFGTNNLLATQSIISGLVVILAFFITFLIDYRKPFKRVVEKAKNF